jgi:hypothetical protein
MRETNGLAVGFCAAKTLTRSVSPPKIPGGDGEAIPVFQGWGAERSVKARGSICFSAKGGQLNG